jgi:hypothetical protein
MTSAATRQQLHRLTDRAGVLVLLMLEHASIGTIRIVNDTRDWVISGETWIALPFRFKLPQSASGQSGRATLDVDNVGRDLVAELELLPPGAIVLATTRLVSRATPTVVDYELTAPLSGVRATTTTLTATVGNDDAFRASAVKVRFDPAIAPGLFAG